MMTPHEVERIAKTAAHEAVVETLRTLGFDTDSPFEVQQDQSFLRAMRKGTKSGIGHAIKVIIGAILTAGAGWIWLVFNRPHP